MTTQTMANFQQGVSDRTRGVVTPLNLHFAGLAILLLVNLYLLVHLGITWEAKRSRNAEALEQQRMAMRLAEISAKPLQGLDTKLGDATAQADSFYADRLPAKVSDVFGELGSLAQAKEVKLTRGQYTYAPVLPGTSGELTEVKMDASLSGDYRPLMQLINALERDKMFFTITGVSLTGQQSGTVNLRLRLTSYLRGAVPADADASVTLDEPAPSAGAPAGGSR
jgi:type IV pilus assembly protein PilO